MTTQLLAVHHGGGLGGAPVSLVKLLARLDRNDFASRVAFTEAGAVMEYAGKSGVVVEIVPTGGAFFYSAHARLSVRSIGQFVRTFPGAVQSAQLSLRRQRPDLVHLNTSVLLAWAAAARRERVPVVWMVREVLGPNHWLRRWHAQFIDNHAARVVAISHSVAACLNPPVDVVHNAVDLDEFKLSLLEQAPLVRRELGLPRDRQIVMTIGSVQRPKGHWLLLDAMQLLPANVDLVLVTGGVAPAYVHTPRGRIKRALTLPLDNLDALKREAARRGLRERIHVTGFRTDVARVLAAADVLVFPSTEPEGFGRPIIEAMALARPVVATDIGPSAEVLGAQAGGLVPVDAEELAAAVTSLFDAPDVRAEMGCAGRARVEACFSLDRQVAQMSAIYRQVAQIA